VPLEGKKLWKLYEPDDKLPRYWANLVRHVYACSRGNEAVGEEKWEKKKNNRKEVKNAVWI
jgi:hypothetical protein